MDNIIECLKVCLDDSTCVVTIQYVMTQYHVDSTNAKKYTDP